MSRIRKDSKESRGSKSADLFIRANEYWDRGALKSAFRTFLSAAKKGDSGAQVDLGYFYDTGLGVKPNRDSALYWYRRAYRRGSSGAAANIGTIYRDEGKLALALAWFQRAVKLRDGDANLEIAKIYLHHRSDSPKATYYLKKLCRTKSSDVTEQARKDAQKLLRSIGSARSS